MPGNLLDVLITPRRSGSGGRAQSRGRTRRNDDSRIRMAICDCLTHSVLIVGSISRERRDGVGDLVEKRTGPRGVIDVFFGQFDGDDLTAPGIDAYMQLTPGPPTRRAVLFNQPFTGVPEFKASAVHEEMKRTSSGPAEWR